MNKYNTVTENQAADLRHRLITKPYNREEHDLLDRAIETMQGCKFLLVEVVGGICIARHSSELDTILE